MEIAPLTGRIQMTQISFLWVFEGSCSGRNVFAVNEQEFGSAWTFLSQQYQTTPGHLHYLYFWWELVKASMEASVEYMEAATTSTEAFIASMEAFMEAMEASV